ncbi:unnamed protein product, partial [Darwinula stevensoni]
VVAGHLSLSNPGPQAQIRTVTRAVTHPDYSGSVPVTLCPFGGPKPHIRSTLTVFMRKSFTYAARANPFHSSVVNDITVVTVDPPFEFNEFVGPVTLALDGQQPSTGRGACTASGWGATLTGGASNELLYVNIDFIDDETCMEMWAPDGSSPIPEQNICAGVEEGFHTVCYGDSGGPMVCDADDGGRYLFGSTSWGPSNCGIPERPAVWAEVPYFTEFILEQMEGA